MSTGLRFDRHFRVDNTTTSSHPLQVTRSNSSLVSCKVLVLELTLEHVGHSFESAVRVIREATVLVDRELVEHEERVVVTEFGASDGSTDTGTDSLGLFLREDGLSDRSGEGD